MIKELQWVIAGCLALVTLIFCMRTCDRDARYGRCLKEKSAEQCAGLKP
jgi:hypothetical protein